MELLGMRTCRRIWEDYYLPIDGMYLTRLNESLHRLYINPPQVTEEMIQIAWSNAEREEIVLQPIEEDGFSTELYQTLREIITDDLWNSNSDIIDSALESMETYIY